MNPATYIPIAMMLLILFLTLRNQKQAMMKMQITRRKREDSGKMKELAREFIGKECLIYSFNGNQLEGVVKDVREGALLLEKDGTLEAVNLDFVVRIREYPKNKKGKKKSVVLD